VSSVGAAVWCDVAPVLLSTSSRKVSVYQILDTVRSEANAHGAKFEILGQYLFGCTKGTLEYWIAVRADFDEPG
jgi:hypothetical protein